MLSRPQVYYTLHAPWAESLETIGINSDEGVTSSYKDFRAEFLPGTTILEFIAYFVRTLAVCVRASAFCCALSLAISVALPPHSIAVSSAYGEQWWALLSAVTSVVNHNINWATTLP